MIVAVIPALNEEATIKGIVLKARRYVDRVVVVDDGSTDRTVEAAVQGGAIVERHGRNRGYGAALQTCFDYAKTVGASAMVILDADGQHEPDEIPIVLGPIVTGKADIVSGSRFVSNNSNGMPLYRKFGIKLLTFVMNMLDLRVGDSQCGFRAYSKEAIDLVQPQENGMSASCEILLIASRHGLRVLEVPVTCNYGLRTSTMNPMRQGLSILVFLVKTFLTDNGSIGHKKTYNTTANVSE